ncbi:hypothetical protein JTE90_007872 [Oedothorax gibbosus]|uniref:Uncharacterized protein n=1 Tax=Oedothorax gibbosus TaxID=931172 RepID=A0AAV6VH95_9ARAC|nr:hypothetical protein JTE90_007872 [Oedothorax gibbosus]
MFRRSHENEKGKNIGGTNGPSFGTKNSFPHTENADCGTATNALEKSSKISDCFDRRQVQQKTYKPKNVILWLAGNCSVAEMINLP